ncbi:hypothetical protein BDR07DRAFT_1481132 [Suillus spraguei]|nr:hypothetical protein BDR07DRAFT_1481132 [Suillus spraguei]
MDRPDSQPGFNLEMSLLMAQPQAALLVVNVEMSLPLAQPPLVPRFNFSMDIDMPAAPSLTPAMSKFNFSMNLSIPSAIPPTSLHTQQPFNLEFNNPGNPTQVNASGSTVSSQPTEKPITSIPTPKLFNLGFNLPVQSKELLPATASSQMFNLGFNLSIVVSHAILPAIHPGLVPTQADTSHHFGCEPLSPIGEWQLELIKVPEPTPTAASPVPLPALPAAAPAPSATAEAVAGPSTGQAAPRLFTNYVPCELPPISGHM